MGFRQLLELLDWPPIFLVSLEQFEHVAGWRPDGRWPGGNDARHRIITVIPGLKRKPRTNTLLHEMVHILEPNWAEWKIELVAEKIVGGGGRGEYCKLYGHTPDELPPRKSLICLLQKRSNLLKSSRASERC